MKRLQQFLAAVLLLSIGIPLLGAGDQSTDTGAKTVLGPANRELADGAHALLAGDYQEGIRLTRLGLDRAFNDRERQAGYSNLCAGYLRLKQWETALDYCNEALTINARNWRALNNRLLVYIMLEQYSAAKADLELAEEIAPNSRSVQAARAVYMDATEPVVPNIEIDDRRDTGD